MNTKHFLSQLLTGIFLFGVICLSNAQQVFTVTNNGDHHSPSVAGELRYAIERANDVSGVPIIKFNIPYVNSSSVVIHLDSLLPTITQPMWIDGINATTGNILIDGNNLNNTPAGWYSIGLYVRSNTLGKVRLTGLELRNFEYGISNRYTDSTEVTNCNISNTSISSILIHSSSYCIIKGNTITSKGRGVLIQNAESNICEKNIIGGTVGCERNTFSCDSVAIDHGIYGFAFHRYNTFSGNRFIDCKEEAINLRGVCNENRLPPSISVTGCTASGVTIANGKVEIFSCPTNDRKSANYYLITAQANSSGVWTANLKFLPDNFICATVTDLNGNTSGLSNGVSVTHSVFGPVAPNGGIGCIGSPVTFTNSTSGCQGINYLWDFHDGSPLTANPTHYFSTTGPHTLNLLAIINECDVIQQGGRITIEVCPPPPCENCIGSFAPEPGDYIISAWVKKETSSPTDLTYTDPQITIQFLPSSAEGPFSAEGQIIDGWQRIEKKFTIPPGTTGMNVILKCVTNACLFDDIRIFPLNGSMKSYVYDPLNLRLVAELDERNYSTFYEYDEEGKLVRVKKETEKGIMTIKENKNSTNKR